MSNSKRFRFHGSSPLSQEISETLRSGNEGSGELNLELVDLDKIEPDPENPRKLKISKAEIQQWREFWREDRPSVLDNASVPPNIEKLLGMADTIGKVGVQQPIKVYRHGERFRILLGERRYWASMLAGQRTIPTWVLARRPRTVRAIQFIENFQRDGLTLTEKIGNIGGLAKELEQQLTSSLLANEIGVSERQARKYLAVMRGPDDLLSAIAGDLVKSLDIAAAISAIDDPEERAKAIEASSNGSWETYLKEKDAKTKKEKQPESEGKRAGRRASQVTLGTTKNTVLIREIVRRIAGEEACANIDWGDYSSINTAWKDLLRRLEKEL